MPMTDSGDYTITIATRTDDIDVVHDMLEKVWAKSPSVSATDRVSFETALIELSSNVIRHADDGSGIQCVLTVGVSDARIEARLTDTGMASDVELAGHTMPEEFAESGRGFAMIKALVDEVEYVRTGSINHWRISRSRTE
jgi:serine/threonine-protein kinase RsbW